MERTYSNIVLGLKRSLQSLKTLDKETYNAFMKCLNKFSKDEIVSFFGEIEQDLNTGRKNFGEKRKLTAIRRRTLKGEVLSLSEVDVYYDGAYAICIESFSKGLKDSYNSYRLVPMIEDIQNYNENMGTLFFEKVTKIKADESEKLYYGIKKSKNGYELFSQSSSQNIVNSQKIKSLPSGRGCDLTK